MNRNNNYRHGNNNQNNSNGRNNNWNNGKNGGQNRGNDRDRGRQFTERRPSLTPEQQKAIAENESAIKEFKANVVTCEICGEPINELSSAMSNKGSGKPVHFDCILNKLNEEEKPGPNDKVTYIGNGKFAVLHFENVHDMRHFTILKEIEWEGRDDKRGEWRDTMAGLFSQVK